MKTSILLCLLLSQFALAESAIECKVRGGSEEALSLAPHSFQVSEAGSISLFVNKKEVVTISVDTDESIYYGTHGIDIWLASAKRILAEGNTPVNGHEKYSVKGCKNETSTTATHSFSYRKNGHEKSMGVALYECECSVD